MLFVRIPVKYFLISGLDRQCFLQIFDDKQGEHIGNIFNLFED